MLWDLLVCGLAQVRVQHLFVDLTFEKAIKIALGGPGNGTSWTWWQEDVTSRSLPCRASPQGGTTFKQSSAGRKPSWPEGWPYYKCGAQHDSHGATFWGNGMPCLGEKEAHQKSLPQQSNGCPDPLVRTSMYTKPRRTSLTTLHSTLCTYIVTRPKAKPWQTLTSVEDHNLLMEVGTGVAQW